MLFFASFDSRFLYNHQGLDGPTEVLVAWLASKTGKTQTASVVLKSATGSDKSATVVTLSGNSTVRATHMLDSFHAFNLFSWWL